MKITKERNIFKNIVKVDDESIEKKIQSHWTFAVTYKRILLVPKTSVFTLWRGLAKKDNTISILIKHFILFHM